MSGVFVWQTAFCDLDLILLVCYSIGQLIHY